jgi:hypothetical protein
MNGIPTVQKGRENIDKWNSMKESLCTARTQSPD